MRAPPDIQKKRRSRRESYFLAAQLPAIPVEGQALRSVHRSVQLAHRFRHPRSLCSKGSPDCVSSLSGPAHAGIRPVIRAPPGGDPGTRRRFPAAFRPLAFALSHPVPLRTSATLTVGLPPGLRIPAPARRTLSEVSTFRTHETRTGPGALYTSGTAVSAGHRGVRGRRLPPLNGRSLPPRPCSPARGFGNDEASARVPW